MDYGYIHAADRGGLKYPTLIAVLVGHKVLSVLQILVSKKYESKFLQLQMQKSVTNAIVLLVMSNDEFFQSEANHNCCVCGKHGMDLLKLLIPRYLNVFLGNYTRKCNDAVRAAGGKKRKLKTLTG